MPRKRLSLSVDDALETTEESGDTEGAAASSPLDDEMAAEAAAEEEESTRTLRELQDAELKGMGGILMEDIVFVEENCSFIIAFKGVSYFFFFTLSLQCCGFRAFSSATAGTLNKVVVFFCLFFLSWIFSYGTQDLHISTMSQPNE